MYTVGVLFALVALFCWGLGDFFIQKVTRKIGIIPALFFIAAAGAIFLFPLAWSQLPQLWRSPSSFLLLLLASVIIFFASLFNFEALKQGKISIIEPIIGFELPIIIALGITLRHEHLTLSQTSATLLVFIGIVLAVTTHRFQLHYHRRWLERGVIYAGLGAMGMALTVFIVGVASQETSPLLTVWFTHTFLAIICLVYIVWNGQLRLLKKSVRRWPRIIVGEALFDNIAWVSFGAATTYLPISIATTLSESYIALAVLLGLFVTREKLKRSQIVGVACAVIGIVLLSSLP